MRPINRALLLVTGAVRRSLLPALLLCCANASQGSDTYSTSNRQLSIPTLAIGGATYTDVVVVVGTLVSGPSGTVANGSQDSYEPTTEQLTAPAAVVGSTTYYNTVATVQGLVSIGAVSGADSYDGSHLTIPSLQVQGGPTYANVVLTVNTGDLISVGGGMPRLSRDSYDPVTRQLSVPAVTFNGKVYTNVLLSANSSQVASVGGTANTDTVTGTISGWSASYAPASLSMTATPPAFWVFDTNGTFSVTVAADSAYDLQGIAIADIGGATGCVPANGSGVATGPVTDIMVICSGSGNPTPNNPASADWGAVAYDQTTNVAGASQDFATQAAAEQAALDSCDSGCEVIYVLAGASPPSSDITPCVAVASNLSNGGSSHSVGVAYGGAGTILMGNAASYAVSNCQTGVNAACVVLLTACNTGNAPGTLTGGGPSLSSSQPTTFSGSFTAPTGVETVSFQFGILNQVTFSDSGTFSGTLGAPAAGKYPVESVTVVSGGLGTFSVTGTAGSDGSLIPSGNGSAWGFLTSSGLFASSCNTITWTSGPLAGQSGTVSTGSGTFSEDYGDNEETVVYPNYLAAGTCTITAQ